MLSKINFTLCILLYVLSGTFCTADAYDKPTLSTEQYKETLYSFSDLYKKDPLLVISRLESLINSHDLTSEQVTETYFRLSNISYFLDNAEDIIKYTDLAIQATENIEGSPFAAHIYHNKSYGMSILLQEGVNKVAQKSISIAQSKGDTETEIHSLNILTEYYIKKERFNFAHKYNAEAISLAKNIGDESLIAGGHYYNGTIYKETLQFEQALESLNKALILLEKNDLLHNAFATRLLLAEVHSSMSQLHQAKAMYSYILAHPEANTQYKAQSYIGLAKISHISGEFKVAEEYLRKSKPFLTEIESVQTKIDWYINKIQSLIHHKKAIEVKVIIDEILSSKYFAFDSLSILNQTKLLHLQAQLSEINADYKTALETYKKYHDAEVANIKNKSDVLFKDIREKYSSDMKDEELKKMEFNLKINKLELENNEQESFYQRIITATSLFLFFVIFYALIKQILIKRELSMMIHTDALTKVSNRYSLMKEGNNIFSKKDPQHKSMSVILLDIDNFKSINDTYGHAKGDEVLKAIAEIGKRLTKDDDWFGRLGGEEFVSILSSSHIKEAFKIAEKIRLGIYNYDWSQLGLNYQLSASIGVANVDFSEDKKSITSFNTLLNLSDKAMYAAKNTGKNKVVIYSQELTDIMKN